MMKAIETRYKGHRFRSRLEARWAVFLDAAGIEWAYEDEGYVLTNGRYYLPDFYLPRLKVHLEIKPAENYFAQAEAERLCAAFDHPDSPLVVFWGLPGDSFGAAMLTDTCESGGGSAWFDQIYWCAFGEHPEAEAALSLGDRKVEDGDRTIFARHGHFDRAHEMFSRPGGDFSYAGLVGWFDAARAARFEHGESGTA